MRSAPRVCAHAVAIGYMVEILGVYRSLPGGRLVGGIFLSETNPATHAPAKPTSTDLLVGRTARLPWLDVLRGLAVGLVLLRHAAPSVFPAAGIVGVTMFFALSGYLITGLLVRDLDSYGGIRWKRFYLHRVYRLIPALLLLVIVFALVELVWDPIGTRDEIVMSVAIALTYTADFPFAQAASETIGHLWSLSVEEQFYLVWPAFILLGFTFFARQGLAAWAFAAAAAITAICWTMAFTVDPATLYKFPTTWASAMAIGGGVWLLRERLTSLAARPSWAWAGTGALALMCFMPDAKDNRITYLVMPSAIAVATMLIVTVVERRALPARRVFHAPLRLVACLGVISYSAYLWNLPIVIWWRAATGLPAMADAATIPLTIVAALISWYSVEAFGRRLRSRTDARDQPPAARVDATTMSRA